MYRLQFRRDTKAHWLDADPIPLEGELCYETDTKHVKVGDGVNRYSKLEYSYIVNNISQDTGGSTTLTMSQKAVTEALNAAIARCFSAMKGNTENDYDNTFPAYLYTAEGDDSASKVMDVNRFLNSLNVNGGWNNSGRIPQNLVYVSQYGAYFWVFNGARSYDSDTWVQFAFGADKCAEGISASEDNPRPLFRKCQRGTWTEWKYITELNDGEIQEAKLSLEIQTKLIQRVDFDSLDTYWGHSVEEVYQKCFVDKDVPWRVIAYDNYDHPVGIVDVVSDNMGHSITQILTSHFTYKDGTLLDNTHKDSALTMMFRSYGISRGDGSVEVGKWSSWKPVNDLTDVYVAINSAYNSAYSTQTARFDEILDDVDYLQSTSDDDNLEVSKICYIKKDKVFVGYVAGKYHRNWKTANLFYGPSRRGDFLKDKVYLCGSAAYVWSSEKGELVEISGSGNGFYNVTTEQPLTTGYYNLNTAVAALANASIRDENKYAMILTFEYAAGKWADYRYLGNTLDGFSSPESWEEYGGGKIKTINFNGRNLPIDENGVVKIIFDQISVDSSLDQGSTNPVENQVVAKEISELKNSTFGGMEVYSDDGGETYFIRAYNQKGQTIGSAQQLPATGGGGGGTSTSRILVTAAIDKQQVKEGGKAQLTYSYDHVDAENVSDGVKANITITITRGATQTLQQTYNNVSKGEYTLDISDYLLAGNVDVYVKAVATTAEGVQQTRQAYATISVVTLILTSSYNLASTIANGGYKSSDIIEIPFTITGSGTKNVSMYIDSGTVPTTQTISKSGTVNGSFNISASNLSAGKHSIQLVAERDGLFSDSIYINLLKAGQSTPFIGLKYNDTSGKITFKDFLSPTLVVGQYEELEFEFVCYDPNNIPAKVTELQNGAEVRTLSVPRSSQTYNNRFTQQGTITMQFSCRGYATTFYVSVTESDVEIGETTQGLILKLIAAGRSNGEENPAQWSYGDNVHTTFENVDWKTSGWINNSLKLINGAKALIDFKPFTSDVASTGYTVECEFKISNVLDRSADVITCMNGTKGFQITSEEASMYTGSTKEITDDDGSSIITNVGVGSKFASDITLKVAFIIGKRTDGSLIELYVNGIRSKADIYGTNDSFKQDNPVGITIDSTNADVEVRSIRCYNRAITDDEELSNYIVDRPTMTEMSNLYLKNDVLDEQGITVSIDKLRSKGKGVMLFVREGSLDPVNSNNNKKTDFLTDIYFYSPFGKEYDFVLKNCYMRIQGTSSTKYPRKNYRIYFAKGTDPILYINGIEQTDVDKKGKRKNKYSMRPGAMPMNLFCMKCDYSDSSMTLNTGGAKLYNDLYKELNLLTPPQKLDVTIRASIDGFPIDVYAAETIDSEPEYYGQYNFNNEKSKSGPLFGMEGVTDPSTSEEKVWDCPITLEFLNNMQKLCLFQVDDNMETQFENEFDDALEFNYPEDTYWSAAVAAKNGGTVATETQKTALRRLFSWIKDCLPSGADTTNYKNIDSFKSTKFKNEVGSYFDVNHLCTWYLFTDYFACVDQRAKNMLARTWDGLKWYITYYDGDTQLGLRNDSFLAYLYTIDRETYDDEKRKYAIEGHDSWLWCMVLANLKDELKTCAANLRAKLSVERALKMFNVEQEGNWSERQYNKSGKFKYIDPQIEGVDVGGFLTKYPYIYALQGSREAHRTHFITNRFALLDAKYETGAYRADNIDMYMSRLLSDPANTIDIVANEIYYFGYGTNNTPVMQESQEAKKGQSVQLVFRNAFSMNDPIRIYGASRMKELDMRGSASNITGDLNLNKCKVLRKLDISTNGSPSEGWCIVLDQCKQLTEVNLSGQTNARTGTLSSSELNFENQTKLENLNAGGVMVQSIVFAQGSPITYVKMPNTLKTLRLEYLPLLKRSGLIIENYTNIETFIFSNCPNIDWEDLLNSCPNVKRVRITGIDMNGDGSQLEKYMNLGGIDVNGNEVDTCSLVGTYRLSKYLDEAKYAEYVAQYPELNIIQPEYTTISFNDKEGTSANIANLDNETGYGYSSNYSPSGHVAKILSRRHRVLAKNTGSGIVTICQLHDKNSNYYADNDDIEKATPALLNGSEGQFMMYEPKYWYKGVNDLLNRKKYAYYSSNEECPTALDFLKVEYENLDTKRTGYAIYATTDYNNVTDATLRVSNYTLCSIKVSGKGYKQVRWPSINSAVYGAVFADKEGNILSRMKALSIAGIINGMYCFAQIPENAETLYFTIDPTATFDYVLLTKSDLVEAIEPDWVFHDECLCAVEEAYMIDDLLHSRGSGGSTANINIEDFKIYARNRGKGWQLIDWEMHKDVGNLFFAKYGERDSQGTCGYGSNKSGRTLGATASIGMTDTFANPSNKTENSAYKWNDDSHEAKTDIGAPNVMGYENWYGNKDEWVEKIDFCKDVVDYKYHIEQPDGSDRVVQGLKQSGNLWPISVIHGRYMDTLSAQAGGDSESYYHDDCSQNGTVDRVVFRSSYSAYTNGGVSFSFAGYDRSDVSGFIGSRLAFRGTIVWASSVAAYKATTES